MRAFLVAAVSLLPLMGGPFSHAELAEERRSQLALGALLGEGRLEIIAWPISAELARIRVIGSDDTRTRIGTVAGYEVLVRQAITPEQLQRLTDALLDPVTYADPDIRKPDGTRESSVRLCGGFRPALSLDLHDGDGRTAHVLLCFSCDEAEFSPLIEGKEKRLPMIREPRMKRPGSVRIYLRKRGAERLLRIATEILPTEPALANALRKHRAALDEGGVAPLP